MIVSYGAASREVLDSHREAATRYEANKTVAADLVTVSTFPIAAPPVLQVQATLPIVQKSFLQTYGLYLGVGGAVLALIGAYFIFRKK